MSNRPHPRQARPGIRLPLWALAALALVFATAVIASSVWLFRTVRDMASTASFSDPTFTIPAETSPGAPPVSSSGSDAPAPAADEPLETLAPDAVRVWSGTERITFLFLGVDQRCNEEGPTHTDSLMIATLDPVSLSLSMLSLPRDLWVEIPGFGVDRINRAYFLGEAYEYPGGGQALAMETVQALLGVPIDYYLTVNFDGFVEAVDLIGGIVIDLPEAIDDPNYPDSCYGYEPFYIQAGQQRLDGAAALKYARTRATFGGDVDRAGRQQAVVLAVRNQVTRLNMLPQLIARAPQLWRTFQANVRTNLAVDEAIQLALLAQDIPSENIRTEVLDFNYVYNETTPDGRQVLVPVRDEIRKLRDELFAPAAAPTPTFEDLPALMEAEGARVALYNGTAVFGLAGDTQTYLRARNVTVTEVGNADAATYKTSQIIDFGAHPNTVLFLVQTLGVPPVNVSSGGRPTGDYDVLVILGDDWRVP